MTLEEKYINFVRNAIDITVSRTGYPVLGKILDSTGIADRKKLRKLVNMGLLKSVVVESEGQRFNAYHTERVNPNAIKRKEPELDGTDAGQPSEVHHTEASPVGT